MNTATQVHNERGTSLTTPASTRRPLSSFELSRIHTPWGEAQSGTEYIPGIQSLDTAGHGGFWIASTRLAQMPEAIANTKTFAGQCWYEEDCDWALVAIAFPSLFNDLQLQAAIEIVKRTEYHKPAADWLASTEAQPLHDRIALFMKECGHLFRINGYGSDEDGTWRATFTRIDGKQDAVVMRVETSDLFKSGPLDLVTLFGDRVQFGPVID